MGTSPASWHATAYLPSAWAFARTASGEGHAWGDPQDGPPAGELGAELGVLAQAGQQPVQALGDRLTPGARQRFRPRVHLDPGHHAQLMQGDRERPAHADVLVQRLVAQDHATDAVGEAGRGDQHLPVGPPALRRRRDPGRGQPGRHGGDALVGGQDALARRHQGGRGCCHKSHPAASLARAFW
jgi:hypothetical protein